MEDLAPMEPGRGAARLWCAAIGLLFLLLGGLSVVGLRPGGSSAGAIALVLGAIALLAALTRITYRRRAWVMVALGALAAMFGLMGSGPALGFTVGGIGPGMARALAATALPATLLFRARYRAYAGARWLLGAGLIAALPYLATVTSLVVTGGIGLGQAGALAAIVAVTASLLGFMGSESTGAGAYLALGVVLTLSADVAFAGLAELQELTPEGAIAVVAAAVAFGATSALMTIGLFQIFAWRLAPEARRIDLHRPRKETETATRRSSSGDWLS
jgi:hypothetical protein